MKTKDLLSMLCSNSVSLAGCQVVNIVNPIEDCANLFGDFNSAVLPFPGLYLAEWVDADKMSKIGSPDALLVLDDVKEYGLVHLYRIE